MNSPETAAPTKRGRPRDPGIRDKVLRVTAAHFVERGYDSVTMDGIVTDSGVAKRTLYRWWPTKSAVVADAILDGYIKVPRNPVPHTGDVWVDLETWLSRVAVAIRGPYGEVLRTSTAISATDPALAAKLAATFGLPAVTDVHARLAEAVSSGQIASTADLAATVDVLMSIISYVGMTRQDVGRISAVIAVIRSGVEK